jgi:hypothetical protein
MTISETLKKRWYFPVAILGIIILLNWFGFIAFIAKDPDSTLYLWELNESVVPQGNIFHLSDEDFKVSSKLAPVIRDNTQKAVEIMDDGRLLYKTYFYNNERESFILRYGSSGFFEYNGKYYSYGVILN